MESNDGPQCSSVIKHFLGVVKYRKKTMLTEAFLKRRRRSCAQRKICGLKLLIDIICESVLHLLSKKPTQEEEKTAKESTRKKRDRHMKKKCF